MAIRTNANHEEAEQEGDAELVLCTLTYVGSHSVYQNNNTRSQGGYPALDGFQNGQPKVAKIPSAKLGWWERHNDFEVDYEPEAVARTLYEMNFIPSAIAGPDVDPSIRDEVLELLDLEPATSEEGYREQLAEFLDEEVDEDEVSTGGPSDDRVASLESETERSVLVKVANTFEGIDELKDEEGVSSASHLKQSRLAEFLADKDDSVVNRKIETAEMGGDL